MNLIYQQPLPVNVHGKYTFGLNFKIGSVIRNKENSVDKKCKICRIKSVKFAEKVQVIQKRLCKKKEVTCLCGQ